MNFFFYTLQKCKPKLFHTMELQLLYNSDTNNSQIILIKHTNKKKNNVSSLCFSTNMINATELKAALKKKKKNHVQKSVTTCPV